MDIEKIKKKLFLFLTKVATNISAINVTPKGNIINNIISYFFLLKALIIENEFLNVIAELLPE